MSDSFYIALFGTIGAFLAMVPAAILAWATLVKVQKLQENTSQLQQDTAQLKEEMNGHMTKVLEATAAGKLAEGEKKGRAEKSAEVLTETLRQEARQDARTPTVQQVVVNGPTSAGTVADAQATARDAQKTAKDAQATAKNLTEGTT